jgi:hypothetical protein
MMEQQQQQQAIGVPEIKVNLFPTSSKILNSLVPHETKDDKGNALRALKRVTLFPTPTSLDDSDEITSRADIIEIEVPFIGSEYARNSRDGGDIQSESMSEEEEVEVEREEVAEINILSTTTIAPSEQDEMAYITDFQDDRETTLQVTQQTAPSHRGTTTTTGDSVSHEQSTEDMHAIESRLVDQYRFNLDNLDDDNMIDDDDKFQREKTIKPRRLAFPFNVKIVVNNDDYKSSCKNKRSCSQVNFAKSHNNDREYYLDDEIDADDDLFFKSEPEEELLHYGGGSGNQMKSRRAADDGFFNSFNGISLTPAPRNAFMSSNSLRAPKRPSFIDRLESESSLERSERVNKDLGNLMKFVAVWAHVDKFVSERARSVIRGLAFMADEDYGDYVVGSRRRENNLRAVAENADEPFT